MQPESLNPSISFVIGNSELTNLLVQNKVKELTAERDRLQAIANGLWDEVQATYPTLRNLMSLCISEQWGKKLDAYVRAFGTLIGEKLCWEHEFMFDDMRAGYILGTYIDNKYKKVDVEIYFEHRIPEQKVTKYMEKNEVSLRDALQCLREETEEYASREVEIVLSDEIQDVLSFARNILSDRGVIMAKIRDIVALLANMPELEKQILAQMTTNMLEQNPQLLASLALAAKGLSLPDSLKLLE